MKRRLVCSTLSLFLATGLASAQDSVGSVTNVTGGAETVLVERGAGPLELSTDDPVFAGDKITVMDGGSVEITAYGCTVTLPSASMVIVGADFCEAEPITLAEQGGASPPPVIAAGEGGNTGLLIGAGVLGASAIVAAAASGGDGDRPASP